MQESTTLLLGQAGVGKSTILREIIPEHAFFYTTIKMHMLQVEGFGTLC